MLASRNSKQNMKLDDQNSVGIRNAMIIVDGEIKSGHHQRMQKEMIVISNK